MKRPISNLILLILILSMALSLAGCLATIPSSVSSAAVEPPAAAGTPYPTVTAPYPTETPYPTVTEDYGMETPSATLPEAYPTETPNPTVTADNSQETAREPTTTPFPTPTPDPLQAAYGQVYFTLSRLNVSRLVRLPGACVAGQQACLEPEALSTPFDGNEIFDVTKAGMSWTRDGRYAALATRPKDPVLAGRTNLLVYDALENIWVEIYRADGKYIYPGAWSPDGQWLSFTMVPSAGGLQADDGIYVIHPDGSGPRQMANIEGSILGWIGSSVLAQRTLTSSPAWTYRMELLGLDGQVKPLFTSSRVAFYHLNPDGRSLLATDAAIMDAPVSPKAVDLLSLDGNIIHSFGRYDTPASSIYGGVWSSDGAQVAFASQGRAYVAPRKGSPREVYAAGNRSAGNPEITRLQFSPDQRFLLMRVEDRTSKMVAVSLVDGQVYPVRWPGMSSADQVVGFSWRPQ